MGKYAPFFLLPPRETEEAAIGRRRWPIRPFWATAAENEGERGREVRGCDSHPHLGLGRRAEVGRRERAAAGAGDCGGGAAG
jgi:hypothetical protein